MTGSLRCFCFDERYFCSNGADDHSGQYAGVAMMRKGDIGFVSQFRYSAILFSIIAGYLLFGEWPDLIP